MLCLCMDNLNSFKYLYLITVTPLLTEAPNISNISEMIGFFVHRNQRRQVSLNIWRVITIITNLSS